jgi:hypothetical protein
MKVNEMIKNTNTHKTYLRIEKIYTKSNEVVWTNNQSDLLKSFKIVK